MKRLSDNKSVTNILSKQKVSLNDKESYFKMNIKSLLKPIIPQFIKTRHLSFKRKYHLFQKDLKLFFLKTFMAGKFKEKDIYLITSSPRSGSTMLSNALKAIPKSCVLFEPLHLIHVPEAEEACFSWRTYIPPEKEWPVGKAFLKKVFKGKVINEWTSREMSLREVLNSNTMIVKLVRANRLLPWICNFFNIPKPILLLRHPCAVIASQLKSSSDWNNPKQPDIPNFLEDLPIFKSALKNTKTTEEYLAASWALDQIPVLMQTKSENIIIVTYEELLLKPRETISRVFKLLNLDVNIEEAVSRLKTPSSVVYKSGISGIDGWKKQLSAKQIENILTVVNSFGINFYSKDIEPNYKILYADNLSYQIQKAGSFTL